MINYNSIMKKKMHQTNSTEKKNVIHISSADLKVRNEMHFNIQRKTKANVFKDKTKYTRKRKHKNKFYC